VNPSSTLLMSCGETEIKVFDLLMSGRQTHSFSNHRKTITSLSIDAKNSRLLSGGLDANLKIYDLSTFSVIHSRKYSAPILSVALSVCRCVCVCVCVCRCRCV